MKQVFADTGYWIALFDPKDQLHSRAKTVSKTLGQVIIATSEMVLTEFANHFADKGANFRDTAAKVIDGIRNDPNTRIIPQTSLKFRSALFLYRERLDKQWSLTDCASIQDMQEIGIREVLAHDQHFAQAGFKCLLRQ